MTADRRLLPVGQRRLPGGRVVFSAVSPRARLLGLAGLPRLSPRHALELPLCRSVHTFGMRFALDLLWLDRAGAVVRIDRDVPPRRVRGCLRAASVIEVAAGGGDAWAQALAPSAGRPADCSPGSCT